MAIVGSGKYQHRSMLYKLLRSNWLEPTGWWASTRESDGLARAAKLGFGATHEGGLAAGAADKPDRNCSEATSAYVHRDAAPKPRGRDQTIDLTPAAVGR